MRASLQLRTAQGLALTPQLQQSIRLLQLSTLELQQELEAMLAENPFLEQELEGETDSADLAPEPGTDPAEAGLAADFPDADAARQDDEAYAEHDATLPDTGEVLADQATRFDTLQEQSDDWSSSDAASADGPLHDSDSQYGLPADSSLHSSGGPGSTGDDEEERVGDSSTPLDLHAHLHQQALGLRLSDEERAALFFLIESVNDDGYLEDSLEELADSLLPAASADPKARAELQHHLTMALHLLQSLEPTGVGARNLAECLLLQLQALPAAADAQACRVAQDMCQQPLEYLARRDLRGLGKLTGHSAAALRSALLLIATLEPKPGRRFVQLDHNVVLPDVLVQANRGSDAAQQPWLVRLNPASMPRVRVHEAYARVLRQHRDDGSGVLQQHLQEARWMVKSIQQRADTILRVSQAIVLRQQRFFAEGVLAMEPLVLREIADALELHESTVSRVTSAKYMQTPWGTFELKYFFGSGLASDDGGATSSTAVRAMLASLIAAEPPGKPLSDNRLCELLQEQGIQCARRTVAKYREAMRIPPAHLRKSLQG